MMERLYHLRKKYLRLTPEARAYLETHATKHQLPAGQVFKEQYEHKSCWCFVLQGVVAGEAYTAEGKPFYSWIAFAGSYFTGTKHAFSQQTADITIRCLRDTELLIIPITVFRLAQLTYPCIAELLNVLKQQEISLQQTRTAICASEHKDEVYAAFMDQLPHLARQLDDRHIRQYLGISRSAFKRAKKAYLKRNWKK